MVLLSLTRRFPCLLNAALHSKGGGDGREDGDNNLEDLAPDVGRIVVHSFLLLKVSNWVNLRPLAWRLLVTSPAGEDGRGLVSDAKIQHLFRAMRLIATYCDLLRLSRL